jgi:hypothetical protein
MEASGGNLRKNHINNKSCQKESPHVPQAYQLQNMYNIMYRYVLYYTYIFLLYVINRVNIIT